MTLRAGLSDEGAEAKRVAGARSGPPLSIVHVVVSLDMGGAERLVVDTARAQVERGHRVAVFALGKSANPMLGRILADAGLPVEEIERRPGIDLGLIPRLVAALRSRRPDVVHTHNAPPLIYATPAARLVGATAIHTGHGPGKLSRGAALLAWGASRLTQRYVAVTGSLVEALESSGEVPRDKLRVIENGANLERFHPDDDSRGEVRARLNIPGSAFVIGSVGRLAPEKNYGFLVRASEPLLATGAHLLFVGDGRERARLEALAAASPNAAAIHFVGAQSEVAPFYPAMDVFCLSSTMEGLPLALLEAMASGLPVVASAVGGIPLVVEDDRTGLLVDPGDEPGFIAALRRLEQDRAFLRSLGAAGHARALARYGLDRMVDQYLDLYRETRAAG